MSNVPSVALNNGVEMPLLGFGVYQMTDLEECERSVCDAISIGYRLLDTASSYGNEEAVGRAIERSDVPRGEIFVTTKLWIGDAGDESTKRAFDRSLQRLGLDYLDLYLIHQPYGDVYGAWRAMEHLYRDGRAKAIGLANFLPDRVMDFLVHHDIAPVVDQIETHPFHQQLDTQGFLRENGVQIESWGPFAEGRHNIFHNDVLRTIAEEQGRTVAQVILRWLTQRGVVAIPKSVRRERIEENFQVFDFDLTPANMQAIASLDSGSSSFFDHRDPAMVKTLSEAQRAT
jgi:2,5-diketo-D-gluconate reductase A